MLLQPWELLSFPQPVLFCRSWMNWSETESLRISLPELVKICCLLYGENISHGNKKINMQYYCLYD